MINETIHIPNLLHQSLDVLAQDEIGKDGDTNNCCHSLNGIGFCMYREEEVEIYISDIIFFLETAERDAPRFFSLSHRVCFRGSIVAYAHRIRIAVGTVNVVIRIMMLGIGR